MQDVGHRLTERLDASSSVEADVLHLRVPRELGQQIVEDYIIYSIARVARGIDAAGVYLELTPVVRRDENPVRLCRTAVSYKPSSIYHLPIYPFTHFLFTIYLLSFTIVHSAMEKPSSGLFP